MVAMSSQTPYEKPWSCKGKAELILRFMSTRPFSRNNSSGDRLEHPQSALRFLFCTTFERSENVAFGGQDQRRAVGDTLAVRFQCSQKPVQFDRCC
jgi:hypothetical protein